MYKYKLKTCIMKKITALSIILIIGVLISAFTVPVKFHKVVYENLVYHFASKLIFYF
jgi:hypothetical protein